MEGQKSVIIFVFLVAVILLTRDIDRSAARVVKLVDAGDSKSPAARRAGSSPALGTNLSSIAMAALERLFAFVLNPTSCAD